MNTPYAGIAGIKVDTQKNILEVANAGDVQVISVSKDGKASLLTVDDMSPKVKKTLAKAAEVARLHGVSVRYIMENLSDVRFKAVVEEMYETMRMINRGEIPQITGSPNLRTHQQQFALDNVGYLLIFTDGAVPVDIDIHSEKGLAEFVEIIEERGLEGLYQRVVEAANRDSEFNRYPRFRHLDDRLVIRLNL